MTEIDILKDLEACARENCKGCSMKGKENCGAELIKLAINIINLQKQAIQRGTEACDEMRERIRSAQVMGPEASVEEIVESVNEIITDAYDASGCGDYVGNVIMSCQNFAKLLRLENAYVVFGTHSVYPQIRTDKK